MKTLLAVIFLVSCGVQADQQEAVKKTEVDAVQVVKYRDSLQSYLMQNLGQEYKKSFVSSYTKHTSLTKAEVKFIGNYAWRLFERELITLFLQQLSDEELETCLAGGKLPKPLLAKVDQIINTASKSMQGELHEFITLYENGAYAFLGDLE
jgi:hypothetical protein